MLKAPTPRRRSLLTTDYCLPPTALIHVPVRLNHRVGDAAAGDDGVGGRVPGEALEGREECAQLVALGDGRQRVLGLGLDARDGVVAEDAHHVEVERRLLLALRRGQLLRAED